MVFQFGIVVRGGRVKSHAVRLMSKIVHICYILLVVFINSSFAQKSNVISFSDSNYTDTVKDLIRFKQSWIVEINPKINPYKFVLNVYEKDTTYFERLANTTISIYNNSTGKLLQVIKDTLDYRFISLGYDGEYPDINNDGYADLPIITGNGSHGNTYIDFWLFNPSTSLFVYNKRFANLFALYIDTSDGTFWCNTEISKDKTIQEKYSVINNIPICVYRIIYLTEYDDEGNKYEITDEYKVSNKDTIQVKYCKERIFK